MSRGITTQDPRSFTGGLTPTKSQKRVVETFKAADVELRKIFAPMGRSTELPIGMSDSLSTDDKAMAEIGDSLCVLKRQQSAISGQRSAKKKAES